MSKCTHSHTHGQTHELIIKDLEVAYRHNRVLEDINLHAYCGTSLALVGPNGAGKSTLLKAIAGLVKQRKGHITWSGENNVQTRGGEFAYLPQHEEVNWDFPITVRGVVEMGRYSQLGPWKRFAQKDELAVERALALMEMDGELSNRQISELSGGQNNEPLSPALSHKKHMYYYWMSPLLVSTGIIPQILPVCYAN